MKNIVLFIAVITLQNTLLYSQSDENEYQILKGPYFGQKAPGTTPEVFMPGLFNIYKYIHGKLVFSPDGKEAYWVSTTTDEDGEPVHLALFMKQNKDGIWSSPEKSFFSKQNSENGPNYSPDGKRIYYQSRAALNANGTKDIDIWYRQREGMNWGAARNIGKPINTDEDESQPWVASDGSLYFCRDNKNVVKDQSGGSDIFYSKFSEGRYSEPVVLGSEVNSEYGDTEPTFAPDNSYILFISNRPGGYSRMMNLYLSFRTPEGGFTKAICLSNEFKIDNIWFPTLSYDGKYLFFCGGFPIPKGGYSNSNYYWVSTEVIDRRNPLKIK